MKDVVGNWSGTNVLELERWKLTPGTISGIESVWPVYGLKDYPYQNQPSPDLASPDWNAGILGDVEAATLVASRTSPVKSHVDVTSMVYELRDLPETLQKFWDLWHSYSKSVRKQNRGQAQNSVLDINFGIAPLISDILKLLEFTKALNKRAREMKAIYDRPHGLKRQRVVWSHETQRIDYVAANSFVAGLGVNRRIDTKARQWVSVTWKPWFPWQERPSDEQIANKAIAALTGIRNPWAIAYEIVPWSWLIDYFSNVGQLVELTGNAFEYKIDQCCVMTNIKTLITDSVALAPPSDFTVKTAVGHYELKLRYPTSIGFAVNSSILSTQQLVNLASIAANWKR